MVMMRFITLRDMPLFSDVVPSQAVTIATVYMYGPAAVLVAIGQAHDSRVIAWSPHRQALRLGRELSQPQQLPSCLIPDLQHVQQPVAR